MELETVMPTEVIKTETEMESQIKEIKMELVMVHKMQDPAMVTIMVSKTKEI